MLQLPHLDTIVAVIEEGSFDAAARRLHITPSAVSQRVKAMEADAGQVLVRRGSPATVTEAGEVIVRYAKQVQLLGHDLDRGLERAGAAPALAVGVNADSLATWFLPALAEAHRTTGVLFDILRDDQEYTSTLLRTGAVVAAVTSERRAVQGCTSTPLGVMRYRAVASPEFAAVHELTDLSNLERAPLVEFDRKDGLQRGFLRARLGREPVSPRHFVPTSAEFASAVLLGLGWGMLPDQQSAAGLSTGDLVELAPGHPVDVALHWQRWNLDSALLDELTRVVTTAAAASLEPFSVTS